MEQAVKSTSLETFQPTTNQPIALVFGNEVNGVSQAIMDIADGAIEIPQFGTKHSLNVSVSLGITVWEVFRKIKYSKLIICQFFSIATRKLKN